MSGSYKPGSTCYAVFTTSNPTTRANQDADSLPTAAAVRNGVVDSGFALTVAKIGTARYVLTGTVPNTYSDQDRVDLVVSATVAGVSGVGVVDRFTVSARPGLIDAGTAQGFAPSTITLAATSPLTAAIVGTGIVALEAGPGAGQWRRITAVNTSNPSAIVVTVAKPWYGSPAPGSTTYAIRSEDRVQAALDAGDVNGSLPASVTNPVTVGTNNDKAGYSLTQGFPTNFSALGITPAGKISGVALVDTLTTYTGNTPQTGDAYARIGAAGAGLTALGDARLARLDANVSSRSTFAGGAVASVTAPVSARLATDGLDSVTIETGLNARQAMAEILASACGVLSGVPSSGAGTITLRNPSGSATRATVNVDGSGNRTSVTLNPPS